MRYTICLFLCSMMISISYAQKASELTSSDIAYIKQEAINVMDKYELFLNSLAVIPKTKEQEIPKLDKRIKELFLNDRVVIQSDVNPKRGGLNVTENDKVSVANYLNQVFFWYDNNGYSISFDNKTVKKIYNKASGELSVSVIFDNYWGGKNINTPQPYLKTKRMADLVIKKKDNIWKCYIAGVYFFDTESIQYNIKEPVINEVPRDELTDEQIKKCEQEAKAKVKLFYRYIHLLVESKENPQEVKYIIDNICKLFIDETVTIEVNSVNKPEPEIYNLRDYLNRFVDETKKPNYKTVDIFVDTMRLGPIKGLTLRDDGTYIGMMSAEQFFIGKNGETVRYADRTPKQIEIILKKNEKGSIIEVISWSSFLGNIKITGPAVKISGD